MPHSWQLQWLSLKSPEQQVSRKHPRSVATGVYSIPVQKFLGVKDEGQLGKMFLI